MASFIIDANLPRATGDLLKSHGHTFVDVRDLQTSAWMDDEIATYANDHQLVILTSDGDFGNIRDYPPADHQGIVVVYRPYRANTKQVLQLVGEVLDQWPSFEPIAGKLVVVEQGYIRVRS